MKSLLVLTFLCFTLSRASGTSKRVNDFLNIVSGNYDNKAQTQQVGDDHDFIQVRFVPVDIKCLPTGSAYFLEEAANNIIRLFGLAMATEGIEDTVSVTVYNFTDFSNYKPREYNVENLSKISCDDLQELKGCNASFQVSNKGFVYGNFPNCGYTVNGRHPRFVVMFTCDAISSTVALFSEQQSPIEPYEFQRTGLKYPLITPEPGYVTPCDKKDGSIADTANDGPVSQ